MPNTNTVVIAMEPYYLNQADDDIGTLMFKNNTTIHAFGCAVTSFTMVLCYKKVIQERAKQVVVFKNVLQTATDANGNLMYGALAKVAVDNGKYQCRSIQKDEVVAQLKKGNPVVAHIPGHFVVIWGMDETQKENAFYLVKDPGKRKNTNLQQVLDDYHTKTILALYVLE